MKMIFDEIYFKYKSSKLNNLMFVLQFVLCILLIIFVISEFRFVFLHKKEAEKTFINPQYYQVFDNYVGDKETEFLKEQDNLERLHAFYSELMANQEFIFLVQKKQSIYFLEPLKSFEQESLQKSSVPIEFFSSYERGVNVQPTSYRDEDDKEYLASPLKSIQVNENTLSHYNFKITQGRLFNENDYAYKINNMPVLLGSAYKGVFEIDDVFTGWYFGKKTFKVIGFLEPGTYVIENENPLDVSRYIILPSPIISDEMVTSSERRALTSIYFQKNNGLIVTQKNAVYLNNFITELCDSLELVHYSVSKHTPLLADLLNMEINYFIILCGLLLFMVLFFSLFGFSLNFICKIQQDTIKLIPYLLCGMGIKSLKATIIFEVLVIFIISVMTSLLLLMIFSILWRSMIYIPLIYGVIGISCFGIAIAIVLSVILRTLNQIDLSQFLKVDE